MKKFSPKRDISGFSATSWTCHTYAISFILRSSVVAPCKSLSQPPGESPALSQRLRKELEQQFGPEYEAWVTAIGEARAELATRDLTAEDRKEILHELASREFYEKFRDELRKRQNRLERTARRSRPWPARA